ncbi:serine/threonine-protein kinase [Streptomyces tauricus]|uniref:serine/threonine-protein kinase n=1 Tax=Streptomyces tauricus TaxID=68274 RepID=UPI0033B7EC60
MGEVFAGRYELVDPIGHGGVGAVWRAWDHRRRRYVAAKVLQQSDAHSLLRFVREQAVRIDHPHVLAPASWAADDDKVLFTMDLVGGGSLVHLIGDYGPLPPPFVCTLLDQLLAGLAAVHAEGIVHRDIKPANILLESTGTGRPRLRLSDFGISMRLGEPRLTETNYVVGTPGYFAPEQLLGADPDFPADLFAVGLVALYLLEGAKPDAKALVDHFEAHGTPGAPKGIPEPLWQVVASLLEPDPQARFRTANGARKALVSARELLPEPGPDDELIEIFDQLGPLPSGFGPEGPLTRAAATATTATTATAMPRATASEQAQGPGSGVGAGSAPGPGQGSRSGSGSQPGQARRTGSVSGGASPEADTGTASPAGGFPAGGPAVDGPSPGPSPSASAAASGRWTGGIPPQPTIAPAPPRPPTPSDTGSFHLPPPLQEEQSLAPPAPRELPDSAYSPSQSYEPTHVPSPQTPYPTAPAAAPPSTPTPQPQPQSPPPAQPLSAPQLQPQPQPLPLHLPLPQSQPRETASTASYTAQGVRVPPQAQPVARHRARRSRRRPGPPMAVTVPVLLLALICFAVGFWALTQL